jgi:hypothetical protein
MNQTQKLAVLSTASGGALAGFVFCYWIDRPLNPIQLLILLIAAGMLIGRGWLRSGYTRAKV